MTEENRCPICYESLLNGQGTATTRCKHTFHLACLVKAFAIKPTCPLCRGNNVLGKDEEDEIEIRVITHVHCTICEQLCSPGCMLCPDHKCEIYGCVNPKASYHYCDQHLLAGDMIYSGALSIGAVGTNAADIVSINNMYTGASLYVGSMTTGIFSTEYATANMMYSGTSSSLNVD